MLDGLHQKIGDTKNYTKDYPDEKRLIAVAALALASGTGVPNSGLLLRQSNGGLASANFGTVLPGNQYSPALLTFAATDPRGVRKNFSGLYFWAYNSGGASTGTNANNDVGVFLVQKSSGKMCGMLA
jgi:hypothetical protein